MTDDPNTNTFPSSFTKNQLPLGSHLKRRHAAGHAQPPQDGSSQLAPGDRAAARTFVAWASAIEPYPSLEGKC
ncbi:hypothetical protein TcWFU_006464 [Taenia crassiceps]|uniref:Uncharacterized protein n=1 Tax=Taenia crassiceps TaxID=6207 RepID=A0ABR4QLW0_9CEST